MNTKYADRAHTLSGFSISQLKEGEEQKLSFRVKTYDGDGEVDSYADGGDGGGGGGGGVTDKDREQVLLIILS